MKWTHIATILLSMYSAALAGAYENSELKFSLKLPDRFKEIPAPANVVAAFATSDPAQETPDVIVTVTRMHGILRNDRINTANVPDAKLSSTKWKSCDVDIVSYHTTQHDVAFAMRTVPIPLRDEAIQIDVAVPVAQEGQADTVLQEVLANLDGTLYSFPKREGIDPEKLGRSFGSLICILGMAAVGVIIYRRSRSSGQTPQATKASDSTAGKK